MALMTETNPQSMDPRVRRTRQLLQQALSKLLETKEFSKISVQDVAELATLNRATFYDHYPDKFALLECMVASRFYELMTVRGVVFDGSCSSALKAVVLGVCDFLAATPRLECERQGQMEPHLESAVIAVTRGIILEGLKKHSSESALSPEMTATIASWAIYGAATEWVRTPNRCSSEEMAAMAMTLISRLLLPVALTAS